MIWIRVFIVLQRVLKCNPKKVLPSVKRKKSKDDDDEEEWKNRKTMRGNEEEEEITSDVFV